MNFLNDNKNKNDIDKIYITASGGPFLGMNKKNFKKRDSIFFKYEKLY